MRLSLLLRSEVPQAMRPKMVEVLFSLARDPIPPLDNFQVVEDVWLQLCLGNSGEF